MTLSFPIVAHAELNGPATAKPSYQEVGFVEDTGAAIRIEAGDELRVVSQEVPSAVCHLHNGVAQELSAELVIEGIEKFDRMFNALMNGDPDFGIIGGEERARTLRLMEELSGLWIPVRDAAYAVHNNPADTAAVSVVYTSASDLLDKTSVLLSELEAEYSNPVELLYEDAMLLEVSGRQAMLSQRISYLACRKWSGSADDEYIGLLRTAASQYDFAMQALQNGAPELGIKPPPTEEIALALQTVADDSALIREKMSSLFDDGTLTPDRAADLYTILADKMHKLEKIAHLYAEYSKRVY
ncbi:MAG: type IV pili methyl-accepting chemotaxis transducer N-terminal domain-containing protein [Pseudomonadota bacterium]